MRWRPQAWGRWLWALPLTLLPLLLWAAPVLAYAQTRPGEQSTAPSEERSKKRRAQRPGRPGRPGRRGPQTTHGGPGAESSSLMGLVEAAGDASLPGEVVVEGSGGEWLGLVWDAQGNQGVLPTAEVRASQGEQSAGSPHNGYLLNGMQLQPRPAYRIRARERAYGTTATIQWLQAGLEAVQSRWPSAAPLLVLDLSLPQGGVMRGHRSHQSGRDVDLAYYRRDCGQVCRPQLLLARDLDAKRQWRLLRYFLRRKLLEFAFVDYSLQGRLYRQARRAGATPGQLARWFQYPRGAQVPTGIIRHIPNHRDHVHLRFVCPPGESICLPTVGRGRFGDDGPGPVDEEVAPGIYSWVESELERADGQLLELLDRSIGE